tara:strand:+ start:381 stop:536 length:156 start_codon:yes stop_codon:yes gene_type:complete
MEKNWAKELDKDNKVEIEVLIEYDSDKSTPKVISAFTKVENSTPELKVFPN